MSISRIHRAHRQATKRLLLSGNAKLFVADFIAVLIFEFKAMGGAARGIDTRLQPRSMLKRPLIEAR